MTPTRLTEHVYLEADHRAARIMDFLQQMSFTTTTPYLSTSPSPRHFAASIEGWQRPSSDLLQNEFFTQDEPEQPQTETAGDLIRDMVGSPQFADVHCSVSISGVASLVALQRPRTSSV